jgi:hypothetical protein
MENGMDAASQAGGKRKYVTSRQVQAWFLGRSRDNWKKKYMALKAEAKRLQNRVNDVTKSREHWRALAEAAREGADPPGELSDHADRRAAPAGPEAVLKKGRPVDPGPSATHRGGTRG